MGPYLLYLDRPQADPPGQGGKVENSPADGEHPEKTPRKGRKPTLPPCPGGLFCVSPRPSIINMYLFFHFNLDCGAEQPPTLLARGGGGGLSAPGGWVGCVCMCVAYDRIARNYAVPACPAWFTFGFRWLGGCFCECVA